MKYSIGVDIGGTKIASALINDKGSLLSRFELPSTTDNSERLLKQVIRCIEKILENESISIHEIEGIGIGVPGKVNSSLGIAIFQNNLPWRDFHLVTYLKNYFGINNIFLDNDVHMAGLAEWVINGKNTNETFVYLTISTGISCCILNNGEFIRGKGLAGEIGFLPINNPNERLENLSSGKGIEKLFNKNGYNLSASEILKRYYNEDILATKVMETALRSYAQGIYTIICVLDPDKIVLGGGVINNNINLLEDIKKYLLEYLPPKQEEVLNQLCLSKYKENSGLMGASFKCFDFSH